MFWDDGTIDPDMLCWRVGLLEWTAVRSVEDLVNAFTRKLSSKGRSVEGSGSWKPMAGPVLQRMRKERVEPKRSMAPPPLPAPPPDVSEVIRSAIGELSPLLQAPPSKTPIVTVALISSVVSAALVTGFFLYARPQVMPAVTPPELPAPTPVPEPAPAPTLAAPAGSAPTTSAHATVAATPAVPAPEALKPTPPKKVPSRPVKQEASAPVEGEPKDAFDQTFKEVAPENLDSSLPQTLEVSEIMAVIVAHKGDASACASAHPPEDPEASESLVMRWTIRPDGTTSGIAPKTEELVGTPLAECLAKRIRRWTFPKHRQQGEPFEFAFRLSK
jgi:hypothetical protein